ncbi:cytochrome P450 [Fennellomyces sp. T-0311]|nr:cytochrome P450 [Fennellomyces sp. T-0311]
MYDSTTASKAAILGGSITAAIALLALKYNDRPVFAEARKDIPAVRNHPLVGSLFYVTGNRDRLPEFLTEQFEALDTTTMAMHLIGRPTRIATIDPRNIEHIVKNNFANYIRSPPLMQFLKPLLGDGIFTSDGERWRHQRKTASHIFNIVNFRDRFTDVFVRELDIISSYIFDPKAEKEEPVDFHDVMHRFTLDSFVLLGFGIQLDASTNKEASPFVASFDICQNNCFERLHTPTIRLWESLQPILSPRSTPISHHYRVVEDFAYRIIRERRDQLEQGKEFNDLLSKFMATRDQNGETLSDRDLRDTVLNFIIAGRDTTAQTLSWTFYNLMLHPRIEAKLLAEIEKYWPKVSTDSPTLYEIVKSLTYAHAVMYETLRLHPPVAIASRSALEDDIWPDGTHIKKGDVATWSSYAMGRSAKIWGSDAQEYRPERWIDEDGKLKRETQGKWPVFHGGPRVCLGQNLAVLEAVVAIATMMQRYKFTLVTGQHITYYPSLTLPMKGGMQVHVTKRIS